MSQTIDSRVVEMRFDNKEFEANAQETLNTLQNLKRALDENVSTQAFEDLDRAARNVDLSGIESGIEALTDRFSTMGIVGMTVIQNITNALTNTLGSAISKITDGIVSGGLKRAQNIETAKFQLQGILRDAEKVQMAMDNASESVTDTAYALDSAAKAASQLAASGVEVGDQMTSVLKGIAGVAATTSADYDSISHIFTTAAGQGKIMTEQLRQLENRGLNAAAEIAKYFNTVIETGEGATETVKEQIAALTGAKDLIKDSTGAISEAAEESYEIAKKSADKAYKAKQKEYNNEYKALQKSLNEQYNLKKKAYDEEYKALQESLNKELQAVQEANAQRIEELNEKYQADVEAYRAATEEKISLINEEYKESIKLIDEERYERIKAVDDQIKAIQDQAKAEQKALKDQANAEKKAEIEKLLAKAKSNKAKTQAAQVLADFEAELAREQLAEDRANQIEDLQNQKTKINEEAQTKKEEAQKKAESAREAVQTESNAELKAMQKAHQEELKQLRKQQSEEIEQIRTNNTERLQALRESQTNELSVYKEGQNAELEAFRDKQSEELEAFKEFQNEYLEGLKDTAGKAAKYAAKFSGIAKVTEADIREMVTDGLISFDIFSEAMSETFADHAYDANHTFEGVMANIKAALSKVGAMFYQPLIEQDSAVVEMLNDVREKINELKTALEPVATLLTDVILNTFVPKIRQFIQGFDLSFTLKNAQGETNILIEIAGYLLEIFKQITNLAKGVWSYIKPVIEAFKEVFSIKIDTKIIGNFVHYMSDLLENFRASDKAASTIKNTFKSLFGIIKKGFGVVKKLITPLSILIGWVIEGVSYVINLTAGFVDLVAQWVEATKRSEEFQAVMKTVTEWVGKFVDKVRGVKDAVKSSFSDAFGGFDIGKYFAEGFFEGLQSMAKTVVDSVINFGKGILAAFRKVFGIESPAKETFDDAVNFVLGFINGLANMTKKALDAVGEFAGKVLQTLRNFFSEIKWDEILGSVSDAATTFVERFSKSIEEGIPKAGNAIKEFFAKISEDVKNYKFGEETGNNFVLAFISGVGKTLKAIAYGIRDIFLSFIGTLTDLFHNFSIKEAAITAWIWLKEFATDFAEDVKAWAVPIGEAFGKLFGTITPEGVLAMSAGFAVIYGMVKLARSISTIVNPLYAFSGAIFGIKKALLGMSFDYIGSGILKISAAISILIGSIILLYKNIDPENAKQLDITLTIIMGIIAIIGTVAILITKMEGEVTEASKAMDTIARGLKNIENSLGVSIILKTVASVFKTIVASLVVMVILNNQYGEDLKQIAPIMTNILIIIGVIVSVYMALAILVGKITKEVPEIRQGTKDMTTSFLAITAAILLAVLAIKEMIALDVNIKRDGKKLAVLASILLMVGIVAKAAAKTSNTAGGDAGKSYIYSIIGFCILLLMTVHALKKLTKESMNLSRNGKQLLMLAGIFGVLVVVMKALTWATTVADQTIKTDGTKFHSTRTYAGGAGTILAICAALIASIYAIKYLANMETSTYRNGLLKLVGVFAALAGLCVAAGTINSADGFRSILGVAGIISVIFVAIGLISMIDWAGGLKSLTIMGSFLLILAVVLSQVGSIDDKNAKDAVWGIFAIILATGIMIYKLQDIPWKNALSIAGSIASVLVAMGTCVNLMDNVKFSTDAISPFIAGLLSTLAIGGILNYITKDTSASWQTMLSMAASIGACIAAMGWAINQITSVSLSGKDALLKAGAAFAAGLFAVYMIGMILNLLAADMTASWDQMLTEAGTIALVMLALGKAMKLMTSGSQNFSWPAVVGMVTGTAAIGVIGLVLKNLTTGENNINWSDLLAIATASSEVLIAIAASMWIIGQQSGFTKEDALGMFIGAASAGIIAYALYKYTTGQGLTDFESLISVATAISEVLIAIGACIAIIKSDDAKSFTLADAGGMLAGVAAAALIALILWYATSTIDPDACIQTAGGIAAVLLAIGVMTKIMSGVTADIGTAVGTGALLAECLGVAWGVAAILKNYTAEGLNWKDLVGTAAGICVGLAGIALVAGLVGAIGKFINGGDAFNGLVVLDEFIANFVIVLAALSGIKWLVKQAGGDLDEILKDGGATLIQIGEIIGEFLTSIVTGAITEVSKILPVLGLRLTQFSEAATPFFATMASLSDSGILDGAQAIAGVLLALGAAELVGAVTNIFSFFTGGKDDLGAKLESFGEALGKFDEATKDIKDAEHFKTVSEAAGYIVKLSHDIPNSGGLLGIFVGNNDMGLFAHNMETFARCLRTVSVVWDGVKTDNFQKICQDAQYIIDLAHTVPNSGGKLGEWLGDNDIDDFGGMMSRFASCVLNVSKKWDGINTSMFKEVSENSQYLIDLACTVPNSGGKLGEWLGNNDIDQFGGMLEKFSASLIIVSANLAEVNTESITQMADSLTIMLGVAKYIKENKLGKKGWFSKDESLTDFGKSLETFSESIRIINTEKLVFIDRFQTMITYLTAFLVIAPQLEKFTGQSFITFLSNLGSKGEEGVNKFLGAFEKAKENVKQAIATLFSAITTEILSETKKNLLESAGRISVTRFIEAFNSEQAKQKVALELNKFIGTIYRVMVEGEGQRSTVVDMMKDAGQKAADGFAEGLNSESSMKKAWSAGFELGRKAYDGSRKALDEHSPSRKMMEVGSYAGEGFVQGLLEWAKAAVNAGGDIGDSAQEGLKEALNNLGKEIQNEGDLTSPVITPILDLSEIEKNADSISALLNINKPIGLAANAGLSFTGGLNNLLSNIQASIPDNTNDDVILAINGLRDDLNVLSARVNNLQVVMDTGELVGVITDPIDNQLGWNTVLAERGVR